MALPEMTTESLCRTQTDPQHYENAWGQSCQLEESIVEQAINLSRKSFAKVPHLTLFSKINQTNSPGKTGAPVEAEKMKNKKWLYKHLFSH